MGCCAGHTITCDDAGLSRKTPFITVMWKQCQNLDWITVQTTRVVLLAPNFMNHLVTSIKRVLHKKIHIPGHDPL